MLKRTVAGILAALFGIAIIIFRDTPALVIVVGALSVLATREIEKVIGITNKAIYYISLVFSGLVVVYYEFRPELADMGIVIPTTIAFAVYCVLVFMLMLTDFEHTKFEQVASVIVASALVPWAFSTLIFLNDMSETYPEKFDKSYDLFFILFGLFAAWLTDTFAYFTGRFLGKHKMCPNISPKKTVEGAIGGVLGCILSCVILYVIFENKVFEIHSLSIWWVIAVSVILSLVGMCGDLTASVVKRNFGVKDFGNILPGHGGVMDRFDSGLFVLSMLYAIITITGNVL
ncbi:MAG: CDP-archaeol synthase [Clostridia bacterium]|nr:CDP-archaeol synthase [Clostridia bacterium]